MIETDAPRGPVASPAPEPKPNGPGMAPAEPGAQEPEPAEPPQMMEPPQEMEPPEEPAPLPVPACAGDAPFGEPELLELDPGLSIAGAWLSPDGLELIVGARPQAAALDGQGFDLMRALRPDLDSDFEKLSPIEELNTPYLERMPTLTPDGLTIFFESSRSEESSDIYVADRSELDAPFGEARRAQPISTQRNDVPGAVSLHTSTLYFSADRLGGPGFENIYQAARQGADTFGETFLISSIDSDDSNLAPAPSSDELTLYFSSNRQNSDLTYDVYRARRASLNGFYGLPVRVAELSNEGGSDLVAWLSSDECTILITREVQPGTGHFALFQARR